MDESVATELSSTEWQRIASRKAFQNDLPGAIQAMEQAVGVDPNSFHHWMWLGRLYRQVGDAENSVRTAREGLRCLRNHPNPAISPEERTRLIVRTSLHAGDTPGAHSAVQRLEALRRTVLEACLQASSFGAWYEADLSGAATFETLLELHRLLADPEGIGTALDRYSQSLELGLRLGEEEEAGEEELVLIRKRRGQLMGQTTAIELH